MKSKYFTGYNFPFLINFRFLCSMKKTILLLFIISSFTSIDLIAQPFVDIVNFNAQKFTATYKDSTQWKNNTDSYTLNLFLPKELKNGNTILVRINSEMMNATITPFNSYSYQLSSISMPVGMQFVSKNKKWKTVALIIPKVASDFREKIHRNNCQIGGIFLENFIVNEKLKIKAGLYYNTEAFGDFYVPLVGIDWHLTKRIEFYGVLPTNYKMEFNVIKNKLYTGLNFKSFTRSFRLSSKSKFDYVRYDEIQLKFFMDYFLYKKLLMYAEVGYAIGKSPLEYRNNTSDKVNFNPIYTALQPYPTFTIGLAYRLRFDLFKEEEKKGN